MLRRVLPGFALLLWCQGALAQSDAPSSGDALALAGTGAGAALALGSLGAGALVLAAHEDNAGRKLGAYIWLGGVALAPIVAHGVSGEWTRAALFGAVPLLSALGAVLMIERAPVLLEGGELGERRVLAACLGIELLASGVGLFDAINAGARARRQQSQLALAPFLVRGGAGMVLGGRL